MVKVRDVIILRIKHPVTHGNRWTEATVPGVTFRVVKVALIGPNGCPTGYWPYPGAPFYATRGCGPEDFSEMRATQHLAQRYWNGLLQHRNGKPGHFADFSSYSGAFWAVTGERLHKSSLRQAV